MCIHPSILSKSASQFPDEGFDTEVKQHNCVSEEDASSKTRRTKQHSCFSATCAFLDHAGLHTVILANFFADCLISNIMGRVEEGPIPASCISPPTLIKSDMLQSIN